MATSVERWIVLNRHKINAKDQRDSDYFLKMSLALSLFLLYERSPTKTVGGSLTAQAFAYFIYDDIFPRNKTLVFFSFAPS